MMRGGEETMNDQPKKGLNETQENTEQSSYKSGSDVHKDTSQMTETGQKGGKATSTAQDTTDMERKDGEPLSEESDTGESSGNKTDQ